MCGRDLNAAFIKSHGKRMFDLNCLAVVNLLVWNLIEADRTVSSFGCEEKFRGALNIAPDIYKGNVWTASKT